VHPIVFPRYGNVALLGPPIITPPELLNAHSTTITTSRYHVYIDSPGSGEQMMCAPKCWLHVDLKPHANNNVLSESKEQGTKSLDKTKLQMLQQKQLSSSEGKGKMERESKGKYVPADGQQPESKKRRLEEAKLLPSKLDRLDAPGSTAILPADGEGDGQPKSKKRKLDRAPSKEIPPPPAAAATAAAAAKAEEPQSPGNGKKKRGKRTRKGVEVCKNPESDQSAPVVEGVVHHQTEQPQSAPATEVIRGSPVVVGKGQHEAKEDTSTPATLNLNDIKKNMRKDKKERKKREKAAAAAAAATGAATGASREKQPPVPPVVSPPPSAAEAVGKEKLPHPAVHGKKINQKSVTHAQKSTRNEERPTAPGVAVTEPQQDNTQPTAAAKVEAEEKNEINNNKNNNTLSVPVPAKQPNNDPVAKESSPCRSSDQDEESGESDSSTTTTTSSSSSSSDDDNNPPIQSALPPSGSIPFNELLLRASLQMKNKNTNDIDKGKYAGQEATQKQEVAKGTSIAANGNGEMAVANNHYNKDDKPKASAPEVTFQWQKPYTSFTSKNVKTLLRSMIKQALEGEHKNKQGSQSAKLPKDYWVKMDKPDWWPLEGFNTDCFKRVEHCAKLYETLRVILANTQGVDLVANPQL